MLTVPWKYPPQHANYSIGTVCNVSGDNIEIYRVGGDEEASIIKAMQTADGRMYKVKADYYARHPEYKCDSKYAQAGTAGLIAFRDETLV